MTKYYFALGLCIAFALGTLMPRLWTHSDVANAAVQASPAEGYTLHIDADRHFGDAHPNEVAHHWCKSGLAGGLIECQIYDSDAPDAHLVAVETIVQPAVWDTFSPSEKALWHWHQTELQKIHATLPGMPPDQQQKLIASILPTHGKVFILWDPMSTNNMPTGNPWVSVLH